jgi:hypothetical protein
MKKNINIIKKRKKLWDLLDWGYRHQPNRFNKNHSLNCGCSMCRARTFFKRKKRRDDRHKSKIELKNKE